MSRSKTIVKSTKYGLKRVKSADGKTSRNKWMKLSAEKRSRTSKMPRKISSEQIASTIASDKGRLEALKTIEKHRSIRTGLLSGATNVSQGIGSLATNEYAKNASSGSRSNLDLTQLVSGGIQQTGTSRDDDEEGSPEVN